MTKTATLYTITPDALRLINMINIPDEAKAKFLDEFVQDCQNKKKLKLNKEGHSEDPVGDAMKTNNKKALDCIIVLTDEGSKKSFFLYNKGRLIFPKEAESEQQELEQKTSVIVEAGSVLYDLPLETIKGDALSPAVSNSQTTQHKSGEVYYKPGITNTEQLYHEPSSGPQYSDVQDTQTTGYVKMSLRTEPPYNTLFGKQTASKVQIENPMQNSVYNTLRSEKTNQHYENVVFYENAKQIIQELENKSNIKERGSQSQTSQKVRVHTLLQSNIKERGS